MLPLQIWTTPMTMMRPRAKSFPAVKTSWTQVAHRTLWQFTHVSSTEDGNRWHHNTTGFREQSWICSMVFYGVMFRFRSFCIFSLMFNWRSALSTVNWTILASSSGPEGRHRLSRNAKYVHPCSHVPVRINFESLGKLTVTLQKLWPSTVCFYFKAALCVKSTTEPIPNLLSLFTLLYSPNTFIKTHCSERSPPSAETWCDENPSSGVFVSDSEQTEEAVHIQRQTAASREMLLSGGRQEGKRGCSM